ncbi:MAG: hypothetical protein ABI624_23150 [Casimicrobiaceae bacterium]
MPLRTHDGIANRAHITSWIATRAAQPEPGCVKFARQLAFVLSTYGALLPFEACAEDFDPRRDLSVSGFGTAGLTHNNTGGAEFLRDILQPRGVADGWSANVDSRFGLQLNARFTPEVEGVLQVVSAYNYAGNYDPEVTWAFVSYSPVPDFKVRGGRLGWDVYMLSDSRDVGYSYLWVRPPVDYYGPLQISHIDGADLVLKREAAGGLASVKLYAGYADQKVPTPPAGFLDLAGSRVLGINLYYQKGDWLVQGGYTSVRIRNELSSFAPLLAGLRATGSPAAATVADDLALAGKTITIVAAGAYYEHGPWQAQFMLNRQNSNSLAAPERDAGYLSLGYRIEEWTPFAVIAGTRSKASQYNTGLPLPNPLDDAVATALAGAQSRQYTLSLGARYDFMHNADLKFQLDQVRVQDGAAFLFRNPQPGWNGRATVFSVALDFVF